MIVKGDRITARWYDAGNILGTSLAGVQMKVSAQERVVSGIIRHIRVSDPNAVYPEAIFIDPYSEWTGPTMRPPRCTCPNEHVLIKPGWIVSVG